MLKGKLFKMLIVLAIASGLLAACSGRERDTSSAAERPALPPQEVVTNPDSSSLILNTGDTVAGSVPADTNAQRRWSGEVFLSENDYPDLTQQTQIQSDTEAACISLEDSGSPRRWGGCAE